MVDLRALLVTLTLLTAGYVTESECVPTPTWNCGAQVALGGGLYYDADCWRYVYPDGRAEIVYKMKSDQCAVWEYAGALVNLRRAQGLALPWCNLAWYRERYPMLVNQDPSVELEECVAATVTATGELPYEWRTGEVG